MADQPVVLPAWMIKKQKEADSEIPKLFFFLKKELGMSYAEFLDMPIPAILSLTENMSEYNKEQQKQMKKANRGK